MFSVVPLIATRLADALGAGWDVADGTRPLDRRTLPRADVRLEDASLTNASGPNVTLQPRYVLALVVNAEATAYAALDAAVDTAIVRVHHWRPGQQHMRLAMQGLRSMDFADQALIGFELIFALTTTRPGCNE